MPSHPDRVRALPLPAGYQFGDGRTPTEACRHPNQKYDIARLAWVCPCGWLYTDDSPATPKGPAAFPAAAPWRSSATNAADRLGRDRGYATSFADRRGQVADAVQVRTPTHWNTIEGGDH